MRIDSISQNSSVKQPVEVATTTNISLTGLQTIDGILVSEGDRVLVKNQTYSTLNGIYIASSSAWYRAFDANTTASVPSGMQVFVDKGVTQADTTWVLTTNGTITLGTSNLSFTKLADITVFNQLISNVVGGLSKNGNNVSIVSANPGIAVNSSDIALTLDGTSLAITSNGLQIAADGVQSSHIANSAVTVSKLGTGAIIGTDIQAHKPILDQVGHVTTPPSSTYTLTLADSGFVRCDASNGPLSLTLPAESVSAGYTYLFKKVDTTSNTVTILPSGTDTIENYGSFVLSNPNEYLVLESCGETGHWRIFAGTPSTNKVRNWVASTSSNTLSLVGSHAGSFFCDSSASSSVITLPSYVGNLGLRYLVKKSDTTTNTITVQTANSTELMDMGMVTSVVLYFTDDYIEFQADGDCWSVIRSNLRLSYGPPAYVDDGGTLISFARFHVPFLNSGNNLSSGNLPTYGIGTVPYYLGRDYKIKNIRASIGSALSQNVTFNLRLNGTNTDSYTVTIPAGSLGVSDDLADIVLNANDAMQIYVNTNGQKINSPLCEIEYAWRN